MHKDELIQLHQMLTEIKDYFQRCNPELTFPEYTALKITPGQVHKSKVEHKHAIFILGRELAIAMKDVDGAASKRMSDRMRELAEKAFKEIESLQ